MDDDSALLRLTAIAYGIAIAVHLADHLRRGLDASPGIVLVLGTVAGIFQAVAITAAVLRHERAPSLAVAVGLPNALGVVVVHLLPEWSAVSDAFPGAAAAANVTALSFATAAAEVVAGLAFAWAGWVALRRSQVAA